LGQRVNKNNQSGRKSRNFNNKLHHGFKLPIDLKIFGGLFLALEAKNSW